MKELKESSARWAKKRHLWFRIKKGGNLLMYQQFTETTSFAQAPWQIISFFLFLLAQWRVPLWPDWSLWACKESDFSKEAVPSHICRLLAQPADAARPPCLVFTTMKVEGKNTQTTEETQNNRDKNKLWKFIVKCSSQFFVFDSCKSFFLLIKPGEPDRWAKQISS